MDTQNPAVSAAVFTGKAVNNAGPSSAAEVISASGSCQLSIILQVEFATVSKDVRS